jgi:hypothetical protein
MYARSTVTDRHARWAIIKRDRRGSEKEIPNLKT